MGQSADNHVKIRGTLTKAPYFADKGWAAATLAIKKEGTTYSLWVPLYFPKDIAGNLGSWKASDVLEITGQLDQTKDKKMQVKVDAVSVANTAAAVSVTDGTEITDLDIPF